MGEVLEMSRRILDEHKSLYQKLAGRLLPDR
jgi:hypothetical protein